MDPLLRVARLPAAGDAARHGLSESLDVVLQDGWAPCWEDLRDVALGLYAATSQFDSAARAPDAAAGSAGVTGTPVNPEALAAKVTAAIPKLVHVVSTCTPADNHEHCPVIHAIWSITNISASAQDFVNALLQADVMKVLVSLLQRSFQDGTKPGEPSHASLALAEQTVWALGNLAGEGARTRPAVNASGTVAELTRCLRCTLDMVGAPESCERHGMVAPGPSAAGMAGARVSASGGVRRPRVPSPGLVVPEGPVLNLLKIVTWALSNCVHGGPPSHDVIQPLMKSLTRALLLADAEVLSHACWAISHTCEATPEDMRVAVAELPMPILVMHLQHSSARVIKPALRAVGNIVCAEDDKVQTLTQAVVDAGAVHVLRTLIDHPAPEIAKEACWTLSNITAGTPDQIESVIAAGSLPRLMALVLDPATDPMLRTEACWVILNCTSCGSEAQLQQLVAMRVVDVLWSLLSDHTMLLMAMEGLERIVEMCHANVFRAKPAELADAQQRVMLIAQGVTPRPLGTEHMIVPAEGGRPAYLVPAACGEVLMGLAKIRTMMSNASANMGHKMSRLWEEYYTSCKLCDAAYPVALQVVSYCRECRCNVCANCDCSQYHLDAQAALWDELDFSTADGSASNAQAGAKKSKSKKKKQKAKAKRAAAREAAAAAAAEADRQARIAAAAAAAAEEARVKVRAELELQRKRDEEALALLRAREAEEAAAAIAASELAEAQRAAAAATTQKPAPVPSSVASESRRAARPPAAAPADQSTRKATAPQRAGGRGASTAAPGTSRATAKRSAARQRSVSDNPPHSKPMPHASQAIPVAALDTPPPPGLHHTSPDARRERATSLHMPDAQHVATMAPPFGAFASAADVPAIFSPGHGEIPMPALAPELVAPDPDLGLWGYDNAGLDGPASLGVSESLGLLDTEFAHSGALTMLPWKSDGLASQPVQAGPFGEPSMALGGLVSELSSGLLADTREDDVPGLGISGPSLGLG